LMQQAGAAPGTASTSAAAPAAAETTVPAAAAADARSRDGQRTRDRDGR